METVTIGVYTLDRLIRDLDTAISVCDNVVSSDHPDYEKTYPYAAGYSRSAMKSTLKELKSIKQQTN